MSRYDDVNPMDIDPETGAPYANYSSPALDTSFHDHEMDVDDDEEEEEAEMIDAMDAARAASWPMLERLNAMIADGLDFATMTNAYAEHQARTRPDLEPFLGAADSVDGVCEIANPAIVSDSEDGAYVLAWVWVSNEDAGIEPASDGDEFEGDD